ncbi:LuxQ periplasmic sensor domain-containing protein [Vibrio hippocampi]|uniref:Autoinducer 2 sensor kinase/phosphatase LuxQ n=1 Tax=Vibrio hippocampi TaxID=654686 RepID=A0ABM8ZMF5_9VIBR|nr:LuxQ periplasmic sensor domain-containing protein [Vibrio hippocampi]CAH0529640.1 Autoinducer 2 sensor kinase/phosphatase LuxQ [Vibrio hippocampi]
MSLTYFNSRKSLATLITRTVAWVIGTFTLAILLQSWNLSRDIITQEVQRTSKQTRQLVLNFFDYRLASLQILQDSNAKSDAVEQYFQDVDTKALDYFFLREDNLEPLHSPDFRFITHLRDVIWDDGNALFYGLEDYSLFELRSQVEFQNQWAVVSVSSQLGERHILVRKTPIIASESGEVLGYLYVGLVLNDNIALLSRLMEGTNSDDVMLLHKGQFIASTISSDDHYTLDSISSHIDSGELAFDKVLITETELDMGESSLKLNVYSIQRNPGVLALKQSYLLWIVCSILVIIVLSLALRRWLNRKVTTELASLMQYTAIAGNKDRFTPYDGSSIYEFNHIGRTLSNTFERLSEQEKLFQDLFNFSLSPIIVWKENGKILQINPAGRKALGVEGVDEDTAQNELMVQFVDLMTLHVIKAKMGATLTGIDVPIGHQTYRWSFSAISAHNDRVLILSQGQDITTLLDAERQSNKARRSAEAAAKARSDFLARMSHEIRTPLNGILGISQLLRVQQGDKRFHEQVDVLYNSGEHLLAVINDILDFSKIENGRFKLEMHQFHFKDVLVALEGIFKPLCDSKGITFNLTTNLDQDILVTSDQVRLNQILFNLVSNAIKFTHEGEVSVAFDYRSHSQNKQGVTQGELHIEIRDSGIGIPDTQLSTIFDPFIQSESTLTREYGGSGLGLAIVKHLVSMFGGDIQLHSQVGIGSIFNLFIPMDSQKGDKGAYRVENTLDFDLFERPLRLLLVEDNHTNAFIARAFCEKYGMEVVWAKDGQEALDCIANQAFDLVLMDNQLPSMSGIEATNMIRNTWHKQVPIYACTADNQESTRQQFIDAGADYIVVKPIKEKALNDSLRYFKKHFFDPSPVLKVDQTRPL